ncbi:MAG: amidohydrolase [Candidatus Marinimicrobia bacterium]|jgi:amidohydrolase|nr:amidohydrolase [Candidatus Neomarinimicrobiota bacterium]MDP6400280.1 amidohydrolase [Candidatus Neomarinimicrobiota bacterium]MDP6615081.1 amidohydrolase [Candidatus Neomarinimicrobiota bacterium]MDP6820727.1 amidohydrolase [Candidatus Neomarinimicrobiota bacterium]MDP7273399.1 amidohydrolase [Candidatus Neomarinimicrobiota bacterium]|tara:strand:+ start:1024 stop:2184 length:1161 start_codon:yes stop_codon:yes gene_type:complete
MNIRPEVEAIKDILIQWRRDFHQYPELGFEEHRTSSIIAETLISFGMSPKTGVGKTGVTADLNFGEGPTIALRADMDALPMQETSGLSFSSKHDGVMHACGHDGHMAMLLGAAKILSQMDKELTGTIRFIFQPAEEGEGGARYMIEDGCLEGVDEIYGIHVWNYQPVGEVGTKEGPILAAADLFDIIIKGVGGHGATPQGTVDAVIVAAHLIQALQTIVSRNTNPLESTVITIGEINGGHNFNIIADKVRLAGTTRAYTKENRSMIQRRMQEIIDGIAKSFGAEITFNYTDGYPPTINHAGPVKKVLQAAGKVVGPGAGEPYLSMGGEDFSYYLQKVPGCFFFVGSAPDGQRQFSTPHHCSHFNMDESALSVGTSVYLHLVEDILG